MSIVRHIYNRVVSFLASLHQGESKEAEELCPVFHNKKI